MVAHPIKPELVGKEISGANDPDDKRLFPEILVVDKAAGFGYVDYLWPRPGAKDPVPERGYFKGFAPWIFYSAPASILVMSKTQFSASRPFNSARWPWWLADIPAQSDRRF